MQIQIQDLYDLSQRTDPSGRSKPVWAISPSPSACMTRLTVYQFLDYMAALKGLRNSRSAIDQVIRAVNLEEKRRARIRTLPEASASGWESHRLCWETRSSSSLTSPPWAWTRRSASTSATSFPQTAQDRLVLLSTHIIEDVQSVCGQLVVMDQGRVLFTGTPEA